MNHIPEYSFAICPPPEVIEKVKELKDELYSKAGWYKSRNAEAHISFNLFDATASELLKWEDRVAGFCAGQSAFNICFDHTDRFNNGAFFLAPSANDKIKIQQCMKAFFACITRTPPTSIEPHMSIGRQLMPHQMSTAIELWGNTIFLINFRVDHVALRKFNPDRRQYEIIKRFAFDC